MQSFFGRLIAGYRESCCNQFRSGLVDDGEAALFGNMEKNEEHICEQTA
jgi:hypothetical protein